MSQVGRGLSQSSADLAYRLSRSRPRRAWNAQQSSQQALADDYGVALALSALVTRIAKCPGDEFTRLPRRRGYAPRPDVLHIRTGWRQVPEDDEPVRVARQFRDETEMVNRRVLLHVGYVAAS